MPESGRVLLDTNILIALFAGDAAVLAAVQGAAAVHVPAIALGELCYGARWRVGCQDIVLIRSR